MIINYNKNNKKQPGVDKSKTTSSLPSTSNAICKITT